MFGWGMALEKRRHGSRRDFAGFGFDGGKDAVAFAAGGFEVGGSEGKAVAYGDAFGVPERDPAPPGAVVVPDVMIGVVFGAAGD